MEQVENQGINMKGKPAGTGQRLYSNADLAYRWQRVNLCIKFHHSEDGRIRK